MHKHVCNQQKVGKAIIFKVWIVSSLECKWIVGFIINFATYVSCEGGF